MIEKITARPRLTAQERRASIVESAIRLFSEKGFRGTTTREVAAAVGVTEPVLYEHFKTKRDLYTAIIDHSSLEGLERLSELAGKYAEMDDDRGFITRLGNEILNWYQSNPQYIRLLLFSALEGHELAQVFHERMGQSFFRVIATYFQRRMEQGAIRRMDPMVAARAVASMFAHCGQMCILFPCSLPDEIRCGAVDAMVSMVLDGMCVDRSEQQ